MRVCRQLLPGEAIRRHEAQEFFRGWASRLAYDRVSTGVCELPSDITTFEQLKYISVCQFLEKLRADGVHLQVLSESQEIPSQLIAMAAMCRFEYEPATKYFLDSKVVSP